MPSLIQPDQLNRIVHQALHDQSAIDMHTHLFAPRFGTPVTNVTGKTDPRGLALWGIDDLVTYHYLVAEVFRVVPATQLSYEQFWRMTKSQQADHIWKHLFVDRTPLSEACRGVLTSLHRLGLDPNEKSLGSYRRFYAKQNLDRYVDQVLELANVSSITMTNEVFDDHEHALWLNTPELGKDSRFKAVLRIDLLLNNWPAAAGKMAAWGYAVHQDLAASSIDEIQRFLRDWIDRIDAIYLAVSFPPEFAYPVEGRDTPATVRQTILQKAVLPVCAEKGLPLAMMIGSRRGANPALRGAGDMVGLSDVQAVVNLCRDYPQNKFFVTMLARENQHELCVAARKFGNLMIFGCWWFLNNPSLIAEIEKMRIELLGTSFIPQHSDARVLDQLIYKWEHTRQVLESVLVEQYANLLATGFQLTPMHIAADIKRMFEGNFSTFLKQ